MMPKKTPKKPEPRVEVSLPQDWLPILEWRDLHYHQQKVFTAAFRKYFTIMFCAGNGSGKTHILYWNLVAMTLGLHPYQKEIGRPPLKIKILTTDFEHGMDTIAKETLLHSTHVRMLDKDIGPIMPKSALSQKGQEKETPWSKEDKSVHWSNKSVWHFMTSEQRRKLHQGTSFDVLACDEEPDHGAFKESVRGLRTAKGGGKVCFSLTPPYLEGQGPSWTKFNIYDPGIKGLDPTIKIIPAAMADNPAITPEFIEEFCKGKTEEEVRVGLYGTYPTWGKLCHPGFEPEMWSPEKKKGNILPWDWEVPWDDDRCKFEFAIDWHDSKPAAAVWTVEDKDGNIIVYDEIRPQDADGKSISELTDIIRDIEGEPYLSRKIRPRYGDPKMRDKSNALIRGFNAWDEFRNCGVRLVEGYNKQPGVGISIMNDFISGDSIEHPRLFVRENCVNLIHALENHYWTHDGKPDPKFSDYPICVRYITWPKSRKAKRARYKNAKKMPLTSYETWTGDRYKKFAGVWR